jgi:hypothetical protein
LLLEVKDRLGVFVGDFESLLARDDKCLDIGIDKPAQPLHLRVDFLDLVEQVKTMTGDLLGRSDWEAFGEKLRLPLDLVVRNAHQT